MLSNGDWLLRDEVRRRSAAVKRDIQCACDAAFLRLREKERQLLRAVDRVAGRQQGDLWAAGLLRRQHETIGTTCPAPLPPLQTMSLSLDTELLNGAIQQFASVRLDGQMTSSVQGTSSSLPDGLEEYGAEEHLVSHKPLPCTPGFVTVTRPPSLPGYHEYFPNPMSVESSLTSGDEYEKFELIGSPLPEGTFRSHPIEIAKDRVGRCRPPAPDGASPTLSECGSPGSPDDGQGSAPPSPAVPHPLADCAEAWLLTPGAGNDYRPVPSPLAQWQAAMSSSTLYVPAFCHAAAPATSAPASNDQDTAERQRWLLQETSEPRQTPRPTPSEPRPSPSEPRQPAGGVGPDRSGRAGSLLTEDWRADWLMATCRDGPSQVSGSHSMELTCRTEGASGGGRERAAADEDMTEAGTAPDLLAPFRRMEHHTDWVAATHC